MDRQEKVGVLKLSGGGGVGVEDYKPPSMLRRGRGNKGGLSSPSVLAGRLFSPLPCSVCAFVCMPVWLCVGGVMQGLCWRRSTIETRELVPLIEHRVAAVEEGWRGCAYYRQPRACWNSGQLWRGSRCWRGCRWPGGSSWQHSVLPFPVLRTTGGGHSSIGKMWARQNHREFRKSVYSNV